MGVAYLNNSPGIMHRLELMVVYYAISLILCGASFIIIDKYAGSAPFVLLFTMLGGVLLTNLFIFRKVTGPKFWLELPIVMTIYIFLALFIPTLLIYRTEFLKELLDWDDFLILKATSLSIIFVQGLWMSYHFGKWIFPKIRIGKQLRPLPISRIYIMLVIVLLTNLLAVLTGTFGVLQNTKIEETSMYSMYIDLGQQLGLFALIILTYYYSHKWILIGLVALLMFSMGILSAQKQAALMPLIVIAVTLLFKTGKLPKGLIVLTILSTLITFIAVSSIRQYYFAQRMEGVTSLSQVKEISTNALSQRNFMRSNKTYNVNDHILIRIFYGSAIGKAIAYCEKNQFGVPENSKLYHVFLSPFYSVVPRFLVPDKPLANFGNWFASEVFVGRKVKYSIGITPIGYGYMVMGTMGVIVVSVLLGLFMAFLYKLLYPGFLLLYILVYVKLILPADVTWELFAGNIKMLLVYGIFYYLLTIRIFPSNYLASD